MPNLTQILQQIVYLTDIAQIIRFVLLLLNCSHQIFKYLDLKWNQEFVSKEVT